MAEMLSDISTAQAAPEQVRQSLSYVYFGGGGGTSAIAKEVVEGLGGDITFVIAVSDSGGSVKNYRNEVGGVGLSDLTKTMHSLGQNEAVRTAIGDDDRFDAEATSDTVVARNERLFEALSDTLGDGFNRDQVRSILAESVTLSQEIAAHHGSMNRIAYANILLGGCKRFFERTGTGDLTTAVATMSSWLGVASNVHVLPAVTEAHDLMMEHVSDGVRRTVATEGEIDDTPITDANSVRVWLQGSHGLPRAPQKVLNAIRNADHAILGPGSPITSLIPALAGEGVQQELKALVERRGNVFMVANLVPEKTMPSLTLEDVENLIGRHAVSPTHSVYNEAEVGEGRVPLRYRDVGRSSAQRIGARLVGAVAEYNAKDVVAQQGLRSPLKTDGPAVARVISHLSLVAA